MYSTHHFHNFDELSANSILSSAVSPDSKLLKSFLVSIVFLFSFHRTYEPESLGMISPKDLHNSYFIYDNQKKAEIWRFVTYVFIHDGPGHIINNILLQLVVGKLNSK